MNGTSRASHARRDRTTPDSGRQNRKRPIAAPTQPAKIAWLPADSMTPRYEAPNPDIDPQILSDVAEALAKDYCKKRIMYITGSDIAEVMRTHEQVEGIFSVEDQSVDGHLMPIVTIHLKGRDAPVALRVDKIRNLAKMYCQSL